MLESGSEVYRVEDTIARIASNAGAQDCVSYITATGIFVGFRSSNYTQLENISKRAINLEKVSAVNQLSRAFAAQELNLSELNQELKQIDREAPQFPLSLQILAAGLVSCTLMYIFGGTWNDFFATFVIGMVGFSLLLLVQKWIDIPYLGEFVAAFAIGFLGYLAVRQHLAENIDNIIIGAVMPLVPGVAITNSFRDILAGHLISGTARITEAIFIASSIGIGIAIVFKLFL
jgi:uncharacterized membrane protein YjjP (DUF1212 family)